jgi:hypothetical protein
VTGSLVTRMRTRALRNPPCAASIDTTLAGGTPWLRSHIDLARLTAN